MMVLQHSSVRKSYSLALYNAKVGIFSQNYDHSSLSLVPPIISLVSLLYLTSSFSFLIMQHAMCYSVRVTAILEN